MMISAGIHACGFAVLMSVAVVPVAAEQGSREEAFIKISQVMVRSAPQHWAGSVAALRYGDRIQILSPATSPEGTPGWLRVRTSGKEGFLHSSALSSKQVVVAGKTSGALPQAPSSDVVLAGKGFNSKVESSYASRVSGANFAAVDDMQKTRVSDAEVRSFVVSGKLGGVR
jgi:hypothetical protein